MHQHPQGWCDTVAIPETSTMAEIGLGKDEPGDAQVHEACTFADTVSPPGAVCQSMLVQAEELTTCRCRAVRVVFAAHCGPVRLEHWHLHPRRKDRDTVGFGRLAQNVGRLDGASLEPPIRLILGRVSETLLSHFSKRRPRI